MRVKTAARIILYGLIVVLLATPFYLTYDHVMCMRRSASGDYAEDAVPLTAHTTRLSGDNITDLSLQAVRVRYAHSGAVPGLVVAPAADPLAALYALRLTAPPVGAGLVLLDADEEPSKEVLAEMKQLSPRGIGQRRKQIILVGEFSQQIRTKLARRFRIRCVDSSGPPLALAVDELVSELNSTVNDERVILVSSEDSRYALPLATWLSRTADHVYPIDSNGPSKDVVSRLQSLQKQLGDKKLNIYLASPLHIAGTAVVEELGKIGQITRVAGRNPEQHALAMARYYDRGTHFGWYSENTPHKDHVHLVGNPEYPEHLIASAQVFSDIWAGPTLLTQSEAICPSVETYLWSIRPSWTDSSAGAPFNYTWIAGGEAIISWPLQARIDYINTAGPYLTQTSRASSGLESLLLLWMTASWLGGVWTWCHSTMRRRTVGQVKRLAWVTAVLTTGPLGLLGYYLSYRGERPLVAADSSSRTPLTQAVAGAVVVVGVTSALMIVTRLVIKGGGAALLMTTGSIFWLGNPGIWSLMVGYAVAAAVVIFVLDPSMDSSISYSKDLGARWPVTLSMVTSAALAFSLAVWLLEYLYLSWPPVVGRTAWWGSASIGAAFALLTTYPLSLYWAAALPQYDRF